MGDNGYAATEETPRQWGGDEPADWLDKWNRNYGFDEGYPIVTRSPKIKEIFTLVGKVAKSNASILLQGETGTGKELLASLVQFLSARADKPFVKVNCAALPETLLESELFGHERGAFTGAINAHSGKFEQADGGTLFLDEISDMSLATQAKILRVLQDQVFYRVGGTKQTKVDVRVVSASNKDLWEEIESGRFRADLFYRLNVVNIHIPALRHRREDIPVIAEFFRRKFAKELGRNCLGFTDDTIEILVKHNWPGNIRELKNMIERAVLVSRDNDHIHPRDLMMPGRDHFAAGGRDRREAGIDGFQTETLNLVQVEHQAILKALDESDWVQKDAAEMLGISPRALNYKISQHQITHTRWRKNA